MNSINNNLKNINIFIGIDVGKYYIDIYNSLTGEYYQKNREWWIIYKKGNN